MNTRARKSIARLIASLLTVILSFTTAMVVTSNATAETDTPSALGPPHHIGYAVPDINTVKSQFEAGIGTQFTPVTTSTIAVTLAGETQPRAVTLQRTHALSRSPVLVFEQASPPVGPWASNGTALTFLSYAVPNMEVAGQGLRDAGFNLAATASDFTFWRGSGGVLIRLVDAGSAPTPSTDTESGLGSIRSITFVPCDTNALKAQLTQALGVHWKIPLLVPLLWQYANGSTKLLTHAVHASTERAPHVTLEKPDPSQQCTSTSTPTHLIYFTPDVAAADSQLAAAGMSHIGRSPLLATYYRSGSSGPYVEVGSTAFQLAELLP